MNISQRIFHYPAYKDIDMVCRREDADELCECIVSYFKGHENGKYKTRVIFERERGFRVRFELQGFLIFQIDVSWSNYLLQEAFVSDSLRRRIDSGGYFVSDRKDELIYRIVDLYQHPQKKRHLGYIRDNLDKLIY